MASYGLYLYHFPLMVMLSDLARSFRLPVNPCYVAAVGVLLALPVAALSWRYIERPLLGLKRRYSYGERPTNLSGPPNHQLAGITQPASDYVQSV
jgi:peptidoglycan/LPS O-acetylase OafA/YrhL